MSEIDYEVVSNIAELGAVPELRRELVILPELRKTNGKVSAFWQNELSTGEHGEYDISDRVFDEFGQVTRIKHTPSRDVRFLAYTTRDGDGHRVFPTIDAAEATLGRWGKSITNKMLQAANKANYEDATSAEEATASAEGKSEETSTSS